MSNKVNVNEILRNCVNRNKLSEKEAKKVYQNIHSSYCHDSDNNRSLSNLERIELKNDFGMFEYLVDKSELVIHISRSQALVKDQRLAINDCIFDEIVKDRVRQVMGI